MSQLTPYLALSDARAAIEWYADVLGAEVSYDPIVMPDGRIGHAELTIDGATFMLADQHPELNVVAPGPKGSEVPCTSPCPTSTDSAQGYAAGVSLDRGPEDREPAGRVAVFGIRSGIAGSSTRRSPEHAWASVVDRTIRRVAVSAGRARGRTPSSRAARTTSAEAWPSAVSDWCTAAGAAG